MSGRPSAERLAEIRNDTRVTHLIRASTVRELFTELDALKEELATVTRELAEWKAKYEVLEYRNTFRGA